MKYLWPLLFLSTSAFSQSTKSEGSKTIVEKHTNTPKKQIEVKKEPDTDVTPGPYKNGKYQSWSKADEDARETEEEKDEQ